MTHRIDRMVAEGLVTRDRDEANRVRVIVEITPEGREKWLDAMRLASVFEEELLQDLDGGERNKLGEVLTASAAQGRGRPAGRRGPARGPGLRRAAGRG